MFVVTFTDLFWSDFRPRDESHGELSASLHPDAFARKKLKSQFTRPASDESNGELSASSHPREDELTAAALPDASARKKMKTKYKNSSDPR